MNDLKKVLASSLSSLYYSARSAIAEYYRVKCSLSHISGGFGDQPWQKYPFPE